MVLSEDSREVLSEVRTIIGRGSGERAAALTAIGLLCSSGAGLRTVVRDLPDLIRRVLTVDTVGFFWADAEGRMTDAYVEQPYFLSADVLLSCQRYQEEDPDNWPSFTENVLAGPVVGYLSAFQTPAFYASRHYAFTYERIGARHILDAVVHDGIPRGCFLFMRRGVHGPYTAEERNLAGTIAALVGLAFRGREIVTPSTRQFHAGLIVFDDRDQIIFRNLRAHQSLWMLARARASMHDEPEEAFDALAQRFCRGLVHEARARGAVSRSASNSWGDFEIQCELDEGGAVATRFLQRRPLAAHLAAELLRLDLPPRRMTVCWLALTGRQRKEIARLAEMSVDTVGEHLNSIFAQFGVATAQELTARFLA